MQVSTSHRGRAQRRITIAAAAATLFTIAAFGASSGASSKATAASSSRPLVADVGLAPSTLDPAEACNTYELGILGSFYVRLTQYATKSGPGGTTQYDPAHIQLWLAKSLAISKNRLVYTFALRSGLKFPSGKPVNAAAVKYSFERVIKMNGCGVAFLADNRYTPPQIKSIATPSALTVVITLNKPDPNALQNWAQPSAGIVDPSVVQAHGGVKANAINQWMTGHVAGYGPFLLKAYQPNKEAVLTANPGFFQQPASKVIDMNFINSDSTLLLQAQSGNADITLFLSKQAVHSLTGNSCCTVILNPVSMYEMILLPNTVAPFNNLKFREALIDAVPYQQILSHIAFGYGTLYYGPWAPAVPWFDKSIEQPRSTNMALALKLLQQSGVHPPVTLPFDVIIGDATELQIATVVQAVWAQLGVHIQIHQMSPAAYVQEVEVTRKDASIQYDGPGVIAPDYQWGYDAQCNAAYNAGRICIPAADKLIAKLSHITDPAQRQTVINAATRLWVADSPRIQVYGDVSATVLSHRVTHYYFDHELDVRTWAR